jgi:hypothetical protein
MHQEGQAIAWPTSCTPCPKRDPCPLGLAQGASNRRPWECSP